MRAVVCYHIWIHLPGISVSEPWRLGIICGWMPGKVHGIQKGVSRACSTPGSASFPGFTAREELNSSLRAQFLETD